MEEGTLYDMLGFIQKRLKEPEFQKVVSAAAGKGGLNAIESQLRADAVKIIHVVLESYKAGENPSLGTLNARFSEVSHDEG